MSSTTMPVQDAIEMPDLILLAEVAKLLAGKLHKSEQSAGRWLIDALQDGHRGIALYELWGGQGHLLGDVDTPGDGCVHPSPRRQWLQGRTFNAVPGIQLLQEGCTLADLAVGVQVAMRRADARRAFGLGNGAALATAAGSAETPEERDERRLADFEAQGGVMARNGSIWSFEVGATGVVAAISAAEKAAGRARWTTKDIGTSLKVAYARRQEKQSRS